MNETDMLLIEFVSLIQGRMREDAMATYEKLRHAEKTNSQRSVFSWACMCYADTFLKEESAIMNDAVSQ